ncbi:DUF2799 domain-containing protein [Marinobacter sp. CHS3-4]|uniref:DUF2799 domain-containing protein n=1 Tax=Marinobacter sp. CHS3-4 TaxID=3045174 RepID=UPI0024B49F43|nr:DUF2799 domain-containing protein [Marinobacter sp. CHS3-4]MDI9245976.1 DUF2799 domain-containing protein [Marinobacter sp. CHS3-4]
MFNRKMSWFAIATVFLILAGCATMNEQECRVADWHAIGYQHGASGQGTQSFSEYQSDCADHNIRADFQAFKEGHESGLSDFCVFERGKNLGLQGASYNANCTASRYPDFKKGYDMGIEGFCTYENGLRTGEAGGKLSPACSEFPRFAEGYQDGYARYEVVEAIDRVEDQLRATEQKIDEEQQFIEDSEALIVRDGTTSKQRADALEDINYHREEMSRLRRELLILEDERSELIHTLETL